jgi:hypothetical protein
MVAAILDILSVTELSHGLQSLSEKAKAGTEFIQRLKGMSEKVHVSLFPWKPDYCMLFVPVIFI